MDRDRPPRDFDRDRRPPQNFDRDQRPPRREFREGDRRPPRPFDRDQRPPGDRDRRPPRDFDRDRRPPRREFRDDDRRPPREGRFRREDDRPRPPQPPPPPPPPAAAPAPPPGTRLINVEEITASVEKLVAGGEGLARFQDLPVFVPRSAPGDFLRLRIVERKPDYGRAEIVNIITPGPDRRPDPVPELSRSGVCDLQHLKDEVQPVLKAAATRETLERLGHIQVPEDTEILTGEPWGYRLRTQIHTDVDPLTGGVRVGYHARGTNEVIAVSRCPLLVPELEELLRELPAHLGPDSPKRLDLAAGDNGEVTVSPLVEGLPHGEVSTQVGDFTYSYDARCFFQGHRGLLPRLVEKTVGDWEGDTAVDLYAGAGLFSLPLARRYDQVIAVESDQIGSRYARLNVKRNKLDNVEVVNRVVESWMPELPPDVDRVVADPPRGGLSKEVVTALLARRPKRITYVSCHAAALARDLRQLQRAYRIESIVFADLFPQTGHMEVIVQLVRLEEAPEEADHPEGR